MRSAVTQTSRIHHWRVERVPLHGGVARVLVVDHDGASRTALVETLARERHEVTVAESMRAASAVLASLRVEIVILAIPEQEAEQRQLLAEAAGIGMLVVALIGPNDEDTRVRALELGADDVLADPVSLRELALRLRALLRRLSPPVRGARTEHVELRTLRIDRAAFAVTVDGRDAQLSRLEVQVLLFLADAGGRVVSREELIESLWRDRSVSPRLVDTAIRRLRSKLGAERDLLRTVRSRGYQLRVPSEGV